MVSDEVLLKGLKNSLSSDKSYENYVVRLNLIKKVCDQDKLIDVMLDPESMYDRLVTKYPNCNSRKTMMVPILTLFRLSPDLSSECYNTWKRRFEECARFVEVDVKKNELKEKQKEKYVSSKEVEEKRLELKKNGNPHRDRLSSQEYLLLTLFCDITPKRSDLGRVRIYFRDDPVIKTENYIVLRDSKSEFESYLVMNVYKTAKTYGRIEEMLSNETKRVLRESLRAYPRNYLFVGRNGRPYETNDAYGKFVGRTFLELFGRAMGTSLWRHVYVSEKVDPNQSERDLETIATSMCHSANVQRYERFSKIAKEHMKTLKKV